LIQGCARPVLQTYPVSLEESTAVLEAFGQYLEISEKVCGCCLDAEADAELVVSGWFSDHMGKLSGYLQAMEPGYLKFVVINPLGQPLLIFVTDGRIFKSLNVYDAKVYAGSVRSETYKRFAPESFDPEFSYYWLTGRLQPGYMQVLQVMRDREQDGFWLQIKQAGLSPESMVLFDPHNLVILRHVLRDENGKHLVDIRYADHQLLPAAADQCRLPARITVASQGNAEKLELKLQAFLREVHFSAEDFQIEIPDNFEELPVN